MVYIVIVVSSNSNVACAFKFVVERSWSLAIHRIYPPEILKLYITQEGMRSPFSSKVWEKSGYNTVVLVRYITKARSY
ncbi:hypothetical protein LINPERHAP2_LOCUS45033 [Linum perenne]